MSGLRIKQDMAIMLVCFVRRTKCQFASWSSQSILTPAVEVSLATHGGRGVQLTGWEFGLAGKRCEKVLLAANHAPKNRNCKNTQKLPIMEKSDFWAKMCPGEPLSDPFLPLKAKASRRSAGYRGWGRFQGWKQAVGWLDLPSGLSDVLGGVQRKPPFPSGKK